LLTNLFALFQRQVRIDVDVLQKLIRWIINDSTIRTKSKIPVAYLSKPDHKLSRVVINCRLTFFFLLPWLGFYLIRYSTIAQYLFGSYAERSIYRKTKSIFYMINKSYFSY
jgi:hypothetical protein